MRILDSAKRRYACKAFDSNKPLSQEQIDTLKQVIKLSPSAINIQAWHFIIATGDSAKAKLADACPGPLTYNAEKIKAAPLVIAFCAKNHVDESDVAQVIEQEFQDGRFPTEAAKNERAELLKNYINECNKDSIQARAWIDKQTYIALGNVLLAAADMGIDSVPIEGFDPEVVNENFNLQEKGYHVTVLAAFGYHSEADFNAQLPKSRLSDTELFTDL